jgi:hypothetical protein
MTLRLVIPSSLCCKSSQGVHEPPFDDLSQLSVPRAKRKVKEQTDSTER